MCLKRVCVLRFRGMYLECPGKDANASTNLMEGLSGFIDVNSNIRVPG
jgi:hypothetical protein